jgi:hypothetical protein
MRQKTNVNWPLNFFTVPMHLRPQSAWQKNGYGLRAHVELAIQPYKRIIGSVTTARVLLKQKIEAWAMRLCATQCPILECRCR